MGLIDTVSPPLFWLFQPTSISGMGRRRKNLHMVEKKSRVSAQGRGSLQGTEHTQGHSCHLGHRWEAIAFHPGAPSHVLSQLCHCARDQVVAPGNEKGTGNYTPSPQCNEELFGEAAKCMREGVALGHSILSRVGKQSLNSTAWEQGEAGRGGWMFQGSCWLSLSK